MSSDEYFDDELDSAFLQEVDAIEAANTSYSAPARMAKHANKLVLPHDVIVLSDSDSFTAVDSGTADPESVAQTRGGNDRHDAQPIAGSSAVHRTSSKGRLQTTLFGDVLQKNASKSKIHNKPVSKAPVERSHSGNRHQVGGRTKKTKQWDHTAFAKSGWRQSAAEKKRKAKSKLFCNEEEEEDGGEEEPVEFEQFPAPLPPMKTKPDLLAGKRWLYPLNHPKRDYQFNIVKRCLFDNTLVALPTGMGKTFIAGVVMLNFFNWFPEGKVVFLAPSKPLVAQQIEACHKSCGIPGSQAAELTGETPKAKRLKLWEAKRVFYMTPQTLLSDLITSNCDPQDIVLIVIDEAHKGTGDYAYAQVLRFMMAKNPHFRVLALTATPGGDPEAVQEIIDRLHISHIEIRDEESLDLRRYMHTKALEQHIVAMSEDVIKIRDLLAKVMQPMIKQIQNAGAMMGSSDPVTLHSFRCQKAIGELHTRKANFLMGTASKLGALARAMGYLLEASTNMCYSTLNGIFLSGEEPNGTKGPTNAQKALQNNPAFQAVMKEIEAQRNRGFSVHPKMDKLRVLLVQYFATKMLDEEETAAGDPPAPDRTDESRVMVFVSFRECVDEVVKFLNRENPLIRATRFIGQGTDKQGKKGIAQREQLEVIKKFKSGEFNVLVATSIGEEGLDIGEVDMIVCYDAQKTPIRMLQRIGRTGRKRDGVVHVLLAQGREERNWDKANDKYKNVQHFIVRAEELELYDDVERLLPDHIKPECSELFMEIEEYVREDQGSRKGSRVDDDGSQLPKSKKRKRDDNPLRNVPEGACAGFVTVKDLLVKDGAKKKRKASPEFDVLAGEDDEDDLEIEAGVFVPPRRTVSTSAVSTEPKTKKLRRAKTIAAGGGDNEKPRPRKSKAKQVALPTSSDFERMGVDDDDDKEIEKGLDLLKKCSRVKSPSLSPSRQKTKREPTTKANDDVIDLITPAHSFREHSATPSLSSSPARWPKPRAGSIASDAEEARKSPSVIVLSSSPDLPLRSRSGSASSGHKPQTTAEKPRSRQRSLSPPSSQGQAGGSMAWLIDDDDDPDVQLEHSSPLPRGEVLLQEETSEDDIDLLSRLDVRSSRSTSQTASLHAKSKSKVAHGKALAAGQMLPPALPARFAEPSSSPSDEALPPATFAVRAPGKTAKKRVVAVDSSPLATPPPSQRRLQREQCSPSPPSRRGNAAKPRKRQFKNLAEAQKRNPWIDVEASHSGDERSVGSSGPEHSGDEYEKDFVTGSPATQASPSYDQSAVYRRSLFTQAPGGAAKNPIFADHPARPGRGSRARNDFSSARHVLSSSPPLEDEDDDYMLGSFIVDDDAEISFSASASSDL
ncbi:P-loop containing nucleoside triphosphate hydrolase protein [Laetiporus sulphureus 93-53]|uniref:ATP-dependent DNA helicase n=1 Tax=Laetiporus sulphureus 93-53 TaxID=1314785 RepID=A0A165E7B2_9APHY|nr:P-loop containing nucleoside triphosphate hydrolase protein [Laetiporus sulphureus 93-53]KZT06380.1 P-loop containing nucleoside triphosphate hydrolase protein [Laetiporus sulphureus 93-53]